METQVEKKEKKAEKPQAISKRLSIGERIAKVAQAVEYIQKEKEQGGLNYRYTSHDAVTAALRTEIFSNGIFVVPSQEYDADKCIMTLTVKFCCVDNPEESVSTSCKTSVCPVKAGYLISPKDFGSAFSHAFKSLLLKFFMIPTGEEDAELRYKNEENHAPIKNHDEKTKKESRNQPPEKRISGKQIEEIESLIQGDHDLLYMVCNKCNVSSLNDIPDSYYGRVITYLKAVISIKNGSEKKQES